MENAAAYRLLILTDSLMLTVDSDHVMKCIITSCYNHNISNPEDYVQSCFKAGPKQTVCVCVRFSLTECGLTGLCCAALAAVVCSGGSLAELDLSCNELGQEGAISLCESLKSPGCSLISLR